MSSQSLPFVKMACSLDTNPKIRIAGREAREIYLFMLRRNGELGMGGVIPAHYMSLQYLSDMLMMTHAEVQTGLRRAVESGLVRDASGTVRDNSDKWDMSKSSLWTICGWEESWGKHSTSEAERKRQYRERKRLSHDVPDTLGHVPDSPDCPDIRVDKRRSDKKETPALPDSCLALADSLRALVLAEQPTNTLANKPWGPVRDKWAKEFAAAIRTDGRTPEAMTAMLAWVFHGQTGRARFVVRAPAKLREKFDDIELRMRQADSASRDQLPLSVNVENYR